MESSPFLVWIERQGSSLTFCPAGEKKIWLLISCVLQEKLIWGSIHCHKYECPLFFISQRVLSKRPNHHWLLSHWTTLEQVFRSCSKTCDEAVESKDTSQAKYYRQLKPLYKLLLKSDDELDYTTFKKWQNFQWRYLTESEVVDRLPSISYELKIAKQFIKSCLAIITRNS